VEAGRVVENGEEDEAPPMPRLVLLPPPLVPDPPPLRLRPQYMGGAVRVCCGLNCWVRFNIAQQNLTPGICFIEDKCAVVSACKRRIRQPPHTPDLES